MKTQTLFKVLPVVLTLGTAFAQTAAERLEQGVQLQTADGDLNAAIVEYKEVLKAATEGNRLAAEARFRLAECFMKLGNKEQMNEHLTALREDFPADNKWVIEAARLAPAETFFHGTPWADGKLHTFEVKVPNGNVMGHFIVGTHAVKERAGEAWETISVRTAGGESLSRSRFLTADYRPVESRWYLGALGDAGISYDDKGVATIRDMETGKVRNTYDHAGSGNGSIPLVENEQMIELIRALDQEIGTKQKTMILAAPNGGMPIPFDLEVTAHEEIKVAAGTFQCAKIETSIKQTFYVSTGEGRELVRMNVGAAKIDLLKSEPWDGKTPKTFKAEHQGVSFSLPGMVLASPAVSNEKVYRLEIWSGDFAGRDGLIEINSKENLLEKAQQSSKEYAGVLHEGFAKNYEVFEVLDEEWDKIEVDGFEAVGMRVMRKVGERETREYQIHGVGEKLALSFRMNYAEADEAKAKARMMEIVETFKWGE